MRGREDLANESEKIRLMRGQDERTTIFPRAVFNPFGTDVPLGTGTNTLRLPFSCSQIHQQFARATAYRMGLVVTGVSKYMGLCPVWES